MSLGGQALSALSALVKPVGPRAHIVLAYENFEHHFENHAAWIARVALPRQYFHVGRYEGYAGRSGQPDSGQHMFRL